MHNAALLGVGVDAHHLYRNEDPMFELWLGTVVDLLERTRAKER
jgi:hypothetical protein